MPGAVVHYNSWLTQLHCLRYASFSSLCLMHLECSELVHVDVSSPEPHPPTQDILQTCSDNHFFLILTSVQYSVAVVRLMRLMVVFRVVAPWSLVKIYQRFKGFCCLRHKGLRQGFRFLRPSLLENIFETSFNKLGFLQTWCFITWTALSSKFLCVKRLWVLQNEE